MVSWGSKVEQVIDEVLHESNTVSVSCTENKHPSRVFDRVELVIEHSVPPEEIMPEKCQHSIHDILVPRFLDQFGQEDK